jgi:glyoxylase-like metal-dependent hydrolase (beta-lactamase superfamily II)
MLTKANFTTVILFFVLLFTQGNTAQAQSYFFERVYGETLAQASYVIGDFNTKEAIVIDPQRDMDVYLEIAKENNLRITKVAETHIHADFLSGSHELAAVTKKANTLFIAVAQKSEVLFSLLGKPETYHSFFPLIPFSIVFILK